MKSMLGNIYSESQKLYRTKTKDLEDRGKIDHLEANLQFRKTIKINSIEGESQRGYDDYDKEVNKKIKEIKRITIGSDNSFLNVQDEEIMNKLITDEMLLSQSSFKGSFASNQKQGQGQEKSTVKANSNVMKKPLGVSQTKNYVQKTVNAK